MLHPWELKCERSLSTGAELSREGGGARALTSQRTVVQNALQRRAWRAVEAQEHSRAQRTAVWQGALQWREQPPT
jgi:hypothetical protein